METATKSLRLLYVPCASEAEAETLARGAMAGKLAACANLFSIRSLFTWQGRDEDARETVLLFKTRPERLAALREYVAAHHSYEVPCILELAAEANASFAAWVGEQTD